MQTVPGEIFVKNDWFNIDRVVPVYFSVPIGVGVISLDEETASKYHFGLGVRALFTDAVGLRVEYKLHSYVDPVTDDNVSNNELSLGVTYYF